MMQENPDNHEFIFKQLSSSQKEPLKLKIIGVFQKLIKKIN